MRKLLEFLGIDRAVSVTLFLRVFQLGAGFVSLLMIPYCLSAAEQGFYVTFGSLTALQIFFDLGLASVLAQFASHEVVNLTWTLRGTLDGNTIAKGRLASLLRIVITWYGGASILLIVILLPGGWIFFGRNPEAATVAHWDVAWVCLIFATAGNLFIGSLLSTLEGCNRIVEVAFCKTMMEFSAYGALWIVLLSGGGILCGVAFQTGRLLIGIVWLVVKYRAFFSDLLRHQFSTLKDAAGKGESDRIHWSEIWPMQWRITLTLMSGYFLVNLFNPTLLEYHGAKAAGQMGLCLSMTGALSNGAISWIGTKYPQFGGLIAKRDFETLNRIFYKSLWQSWSMLLVACLLCWSAVYGLNIIEHPLSTRLLNPVALALLLGTILIGHIISSCAIYLRAHKKEPFMALTLTVSGCVSLSTSIIGPKYGAVGILAGYFGLNATVGLGWALWIFNTKRREWHQPVANISDALVMIASQTPSVK